MKILFVVFIVALYLATMTRVVRRDYVDEDDDQDVGDGYLAPDTVGCSYLGTSGITRCFTGQRTYLCDAAGCERVGP